MQPQVKYLADIIYSERGSGGILKLEINNIFSRSASSAVTVNIFSARRDVVKKRAWQGYPLAEAHVARLKQLLSQLPASGTPSSTRVDGQSYKLKIAAGVVDAEFNWWGKVAGEWQVLNELVELLHSLVVE